MLYPELQVLDPPVLLLDQLLPVITCVSYCILSFRYWILLSFSCTCCISSLLLPVWVAVSWASGTGSSCPSPGPAALIDYLCELLYCELQVLDPPVLLLDQQLLLVTCVSCCILSSRYWILLSFSCTSCISSLFSSTHLQKRKTVNSLERGLYFNPPPPQHMWKMSYKPVYYAEKCDFPKGEGGK